MCDSEEKEALMDVCRERDMVQKICDDMERDKIIKELRGETFQQRELLTNLSES
jgi:hypothetical protein